jgi:hypothetical protein
LLSRGFASMGGGGGGSGGGGSGGGAAGSADRPMAKVGAPATRGAARRVWRRCGLEQC